MLFNSTVYQIGGGGATTRAVYIRPGGGSMTIPIQESATLLCIIGSMYSDAGAAVYQKRDGVFDSVHRVGAISDCTITFNTDSIVITNNRNSGSSYDYAFIGYVAYK